MNCIFALTTPSSVATPPPLTIIIIITKKQNENKKEKGVIEIFLIFILSLYLDKHNKTTLKTNPSARKKYFFSHSFSHKN
jgi:hypothetical protein